VLDVGIAGDGLREPEPGLTNPHQQYLVHTDVPEVWLDGVLMSGGKHYGHLEIDVLPTEAGWQAILKPVHVFPFVDAQGNLQGFERRLYDDIIALGHVATAINESKTGDAGTHQLQLPYPNPFNDTVLVRFQLASLETVRIEIRDNRGALVRELLDRPLAGGLHTVEWNGRDGDGEAAASGIYLISMHAGATRETVEALLVR